MPLPSIFSQLRKDDIVPVFLNGQKNLIVSEEANKLKGSTWSMISGIREAMSGQKLNDPEVPQFNNNLLRPYKSISKGVAKSLKTGYGDDHQKVGSKMLKVLDSYLTYISFYREEERLKQHYSRLLKRMKMTILPGYNICQ